MNLTWTPELRRFREVAAFAAASLPPDIRDKVLRHQRLERDDYVRWHLVLADRGWGAPTWPVEHGGTGWNALQRLIFEVECFKAGAPRLLPFGLSMIGPVHEVRQRRAAGRAAAAHHPRAGLVVPGLFGAGFGFGPGSRCRPAPSATAAMRGQRPEDLDHAGAIRRPHVLPARRAPSAAFPCLLDMRAPGVSVRPIRTLDGGCDVNEVWLENARAGRQPGGEENQGWTYAKPARPRAYRHRRARALPPRAGHPQAHGVAGDFTGPSAAGRHACATAFRASRPTSWRWRCCCCAWPPATARAPGRGVGAEDTRLRNPAGPGHAADGGAGSTAGPTTRTGCWRARTGTGRGRRWRLPPAGYADMRKDMRKTSIYGGTTEVQKGIIARHALGL